MDTYNNILWQRHHMCLLSVVLTSVSQHVGGHLALNINLHKRGIGEDT